MNTLFVGFQHRGFGFSFGEQLIDLIPFTQSQLLIRQSLISNMGLRFSPHIEMSNFDVKVEVSIQFSTVPMTGN